MKIKIECNVCHEQMLQVEKDFLTESELESYKDNSVCSNVHKKEKQAMVVNEQTGSSSEQTILVGDNSVVVLSV